MPPLIALLICTLFVLFLLRLEHKQYPEASHALWIPTIWMLLNLSKPLGVWFSYGGENMESGSPLDRAFLSVILCLALVILTLRQFNWSTSIKENSWVVLLIGYMLVSILWSDIPFTSFKRWIRELVALCMSFLVATEANPRQAIQCVFRRIIYVSVPFSLLLIKYYPHLGVSFARWSGEQMWNGVALQKNGLAFLCSLAIFFFLWSFVRRRQGHNIPTVKHQTQAELLILILAIYLFMGPHHTLACSATSTASLAVGLAAFFSLIWMKKRRKLINQSTVVFLIAFIIAYGIVTPFMGKLTLFDASSILGRSEDLTGRAEIWAILLPYAMQKPIWGYGFGGFWTDAMRELSSSHAHNGSLDVILEVGFVGQIIFSMFLLSCSRKAYREMTQNFDWGIFFLCLLLMAVLHNITESSLTSFSSHMVAILLFCAVSSEESSSRMLYGDRVSLDKTYQVV